MANSRLVRAKGGFSEKLSAYKERRGVNLKFGLANFAYVIQKPSRRHYDSCILSAQINVNRYSSAAKSSKQNPPDRTLDLPLFFYYKHINSPKASLHPGFTSTLRLCLF